MDWVRWKQTLGPILKKYGPVALVVAAGLILLALPSSESREPETAPQPQTRQTDLEEELEALLGKLSGAGNVAVLLTQASGEETLYQTDPDSAGADTVLVTGTDREQRGLVRRVDPPVYLGAVVLCQGADNAGVRLSIVQAVMAATGLSSQRITVLKMK